MVLPPISTLKNCEPKRRSKIRKKMLIVSGGKANNISAEATKVVHVNIGIRMNVIPVVLMLIIVTRKLMPAIKVPKPEIWIPSV